MVVGRAGRATPPSVPSFGARQDKCFNRIFNRWSVDCPSGFLRASRCTSEPEYIQRRVRGTNENMGNGWIRIGLASQVQHKRKWGGVTGLWGMLCRYAARPTAREAKKIRLLKLQCQWPKRRGGEHCKSYWNHHYNVGGVKNSDLWSWLDQFE